MEYPFRNLVFKGGGVKGVAYIGALKVLEEKGSLGQIERIGGTSAGAINAVLQNYGRLPEEIQSRLPLKRIWKVVLEERTSLSPCLSTSRLKLLSS